MLSSGADPQAVAGASLTRLRVSERVGSRHVLLQSMRAHTAALSSVAVARAI